MATLMSFGIDTEKTVGELGIDANRRTLVYKAVYNNSVFDTDEIFRNQYIPKIADPYPFNSSLRVTKIDLAATQNRKVWFLTIYYDPAALIIKARYAYDVKHFTVPYEEAVSNCFAIGFDQSLNSGKADFKPVKNYPIVNAAGDPPNEPVIVKKFYKGVTWWQIESKTQDAYFSSGRFQENIGTTNKSGMNICGINVDACGAIMEDISKERYMYTPPGSTVAERRWKVYYKVRFQNAFENIGNRGLEALDLPLNKSGSKKGKRHVRLSDLNGLNYGKDNIAYGSKEDKEVKEPVWLDNEGKIARAPNPGDNKNSYYISVLAIEPQSWSQKLNIATKRGENLVA